MMMRTSVTSLVILLLLSVVVDCKLIVTVKVLNGAANEPDPNSSVTAFQTQYTNSPNFDIGGVPVLSMTYSPAGPTGPVAPTSPGMPTAPTTPGVPTAPTSPRMPTATTTPGVPTAPTSPGVPTATTTPGVPTAPTSTNAPANPTPATKSPSDSAGNTITATTFVFTLIGLLFCNVEKKQLIVLILVYMMMSSNAIQNYDNCKLLDVDSDYRIYWTISGEVLEIAQTANIQNGWIAIGISPTGTMDGGGNKPGSDIFLGFIGGSDGQTGYIGDYSTIFYDIPIFDATQDTTLVSSSNAGGRISLEWTRLLNTTHGDDQVITPNSPVLVIWSMNNQYTPTNQMTFAKHTKAHPGISIVFSESSTCPGEPGEKTFVIELDQRLIEFDQNAFISNLGTKMGINPNRLVVLDVEEHEEVFCPNCQVVDITFPNYLVPTATTTYVSYGFKLPSDKKRHIIRFEPIVDNAQVLHHMLLYQVAGVPSSLNKTIVESMPISTNTRPVFAWAPGGDRFDLPAVAGFSVGTDVDVDVYIVINNHYNNPAGLRNQRDSSGLRLFLDTPRQYDAAFIMIGLVGQISIPPGQILYRQGGNFTVPSLPFELNYFSSFPHLHVHGVKIWAEQRRNNILIAEPGKNLAWDFNSQKIHTENGTLHSGDVLTVQCLYDSKNVTKTITGGESTENEMCLMGLSYYPAVGSGFMQTIQIPSRTNCDYPCPYLSNNPTLD